MAGSNMESLSNFDDAMLAIQSAATSIAAVSQKLENFEGKQEELLKSVKEISERVAKLEEKNPHVPPADGKGQRQVFPFERVSLL